VKPDVLLQAIAINVAATTLIGSHRCVMTCLSVRYEQYSRRLIRRTWSVGWQRS
jgi:hypothetical protein